MLEVYRDYNRKPDFSVEENFFILYLPNKNYVNIVNDPANDSVNDPVNSGQYLKWYWLVDCSDY